MPNSLEFRAFVCLLLAISAGDVVCGQSPGLNAIVSINGQTSLDCQTSFLTASTWIRTVDGSNNPLLISSNCIVTLSNAAYYSTTLLGGDICRLIIGNVTMQQAGVYDCNPGSAGGLFRSLVTVIDPVASLIVYNVSEVVENDQLNISCSINYTGPLSPAPWLRPLPSWTTLPGQNFVSSKYYPSTNIVTLVATVTVKKPTVPIFQCNTAFAIIGSTAGYNLTAPQDNFSVGKTIELDVQYVPSTPVIGLASGTEVIAINGVPCGISVLKCSSSGNPVPSYSWYDSVKTVLSSTDTLDLAEITRSYKCEAYNTIRGVIQKTSTEHIVTKGDCFSTVDCCVFPRNDTTTVNGTQCPNETAQCDCSQGDSGITLFCYAATYPNPLYMWNGPGVLFGPTDSSVFDKVSANGTYTCTAYFDRTSSNYTGDVSFSSGTDYTTVHECSRQATKTLVNPSTSAAASTTINEQTTTTVFQSPSENSCGAATGAANVAAIALGVLLFISLSVNIIQMVILIWNRRAKRDPFQRTENILQPDMQDLSPETQTPTAYEELSRPAEINLQLSTYEELRHKPATNTNQRY